MNEDKSTRYHRLRRRAHVASVFLMGGALVALVWLRGGAGVAHVVEGGAAILGLSGFTARLFVVALSAVFLVFVLELVSIPASFYAGYVLEHRYELSRQTAKEWWRDRAKAAAIGSSLAVLAAVVVYATMDAWPSAWWVASAAILTILAALLALGAPVVLLPLFYKFEPLPPGELPDRLTRLADRASAPVLGVYEWALGEKSRTANAALVGLGPTRRILLSDTLVREYSADEIEVIIAHELAHHVHGDIWKGVATEAAQMLIALGVSHLVLVYLGPLVGVRGLADPAGMPLLASTLGVCGLLSAPFLLATSRRHERRADRFALDLTSNSDAFVSAMRRLGAQNMADEEPSRLVEWLFHSHPPLAHRIAFARRWAEERSAGAAAS
jgi:STE24 endopeptidase